MAYAIFRTAKYKAPQKISALMVHHLREKPEKVDGADPARSHLNIIIGAANRRAFFKAVRDRIATCTRKPRPDTNRVVEVVATASPAFFEGKSYEEQKAYLLDCVEFAKQKFGPENVVGAYLHFDETSPNVHILCVPIETSVRTTKKLTREITTLNARHFMSGQEKMIGWQDEFALFVQGRGHDLLRGQPKAETYRDHVPVAQYWKDKKREADAAQVAPVDLLTTAASEAKQAANLRRDAQRVQQSAQAARDDAEFDREELLSARNNISAMQAEFDQQRQKVRLDRAAVDAEWALARESRAAAARIESDAERRVLALAKQARHLERAQELAREAKAQADMAAEARDREADRLREAMSGLGAVEDVRKLVRTPELVAMLEFVDKSPMAKKLLNLLKADPLVGEAVALTIAGFTDLGDDGTAVWDSPQANKTACVFVLVQKPKQTSDDPNFSM
jgi:Plasmid recombination enzyme